MPETVVHLVRHGQVENPRRVLYGRLPGYHLSARGRAQAELLAGHFAGARLAAVLASPLERAQQTAAPIAAANGLEVRTDLRLIENSTIFEGAAGNLVWYILRHPKLWWNLRDLRAPSWGERNVDMVERVHAVVDAVREEFAGRQVVLVSHQAPIWVARLAFERRRLSHWPGRRCLHPGQRDHPHLRRGPAHRRQLRRAGRGGAPGPGAHPPARRGSTVRAGSAVGRRHPRWGPGRDGRRSRARASWRTFAPQLDRSRLGSPGPGPAGPLGSGPAAQAARRRSLTSSSEVWGNDR